MTGEIPVTITTDKCSACKPQCVWVTNTQGQGLELKRHAGVRKPNEDEEYRRRAEPVGGGQRLQP